MKNVKKFISIITALTLVVVMACSQPIQAHAATVGNDMYAQRATEELVIDGVTYTFCHFYENGKRTITIANSENAQVEKVSYDPGTEVLSFYERAQESVGTNVIYNEWIYMGSSSHKVSWGESTNSAMVAAAIAVKLGAAMTVAGVTAAMGVAALGVLAASAKGGTIYLTTYYMNVPLQGIQYLYVWSFTADTGEEYGPYQFIDVPTVS